MPPVECKTIVRAIRKDIRLLNATDEHGRTSLMYACIRNDEGCLRELLSMGADVNLVDDEGVSALMLASFHGRFPIAHALIRHGADVDAKDRDQQDSCLLLACRNGHERVAVLLVKENADVHAVNRKGESAFLWSSFHGLERCVLALIARGVDIDVKSRSSRDTPLMAACMKGNVGCASLLIAADASLDERNARGDTALIIACRAGHHAIVQKLVDADADAYIQNGDFRTALQEAIERGHRSCVDALLEFADLCSANGEEDGRKICPITQAPLDCNEGIVINSNSSHKTCYTAETLRTHVNTVRTGRDGRRLPQNDPLTRKPNVKAYDVTDRIRRSPTPSLKCATTRSSS